MERLSSSQPGWGIRGLRFSVPQLDRCTDTGSWKQMLFFGKSVSLGFCVARHPQQNTLGFDSEKKSAGAWLCGKFFYLAVSLNFLQKKRLFWFCGRMAFGEKDNQRKMGRLGILFTDSSQVGKNPSTEGAVFLNQHNLGISIS